MEEGKRTFLELVLGIIICTVPCLIFGILFTGIRASYYIGLCMGTVLALLLVFDMYRSIRKSLLMEEKHAKGYIQKKAAGRMLVSLIVLFITVKIPQMHILGVLLGALTLKFSAYLQPLTHKFLTKINKGR